MGTKWILTDDVALARKSPVNYTVVGVGVAASLLLAGVGQAQCPTPARPAVTYLRPAAPPVYEVPVVTQVVPTYVPILIPAYSFQFLPAVQPVVSGPSLATPTPPPIAEDFWPVVPGAMVGAQPISTLFQQKCVRCHSSPSRVGVDLFDAAGVLLSTANRSRMAKEVREGRMPPKAPLSQAEITSVQNWLTNP